MTFAVTGTRSCTKSSFTGYQSPLTLAKLTDSGLKVSLGPTRHICLSAHPAHIPLISGLEALSLGGNVRQCTPLHRSLHRSAGSICSIPLTSHSVTSSSYKDMKSSSNTVFTHICLSSPNTESRPHSIKLSDNYQGWRSTTALRCIQNSVVNSSLFFVCSCFPLWCAYTYLEEGIKVAHQVIDAHAMRSGAPQIWFWCPCAQGNQ